jgi:colicin import membrane protein
MADDKVALEIFIEADKANLSLGELEKGFEDMKDRLKEVGRGSEEFKTLSTAMANTTSEIKNIELGFEGLDREQVASELGSVAGGIGDITASLVLLGGENETIEQIGASIEKAMAISMGFKGAIEGLSSANKLYNNLLKQGKVALIAKSVAEKAAAAGTWLMTAAQTAFNVVMSMNPIALVVIAITALVAGFILLGKNIKKVIDFALLPMTLVIEGVKAALRALGLMEESTAEQTKKAEEEKAQAALESAEKRTEATEKLIEAHKKMTESIVSDMDFEIRKRKANGEDTAEIEAEKLRILIESAKKEQELQKQKLTDLDNEFKARVKAGKVGPAAVSKLAKAKLETSKAIQEANKEQIASEQDLEIATIEAQNKIDENAKKLSDKRKAQREKDKAAAEKAAADKKKIDEKAAADAKLAAEKAAADAIALEKDKIQLLEDLEAKAIEDKNVRALAELEIAQERERQQLIEKYGLDTELMLALEEEQMLQMNTLIEGIEQEARDKKAEIRQLELDAKKEADAKEIEDEKQKAADKQKIREQSLAASIQVIESISSINDMALQNDLKNAGNNEALKEKLRKASFEREKKLAMALVNGAQAQMSILAQTPKVDFGIATAIAMAAAAVTTIAQIAAIKATSYQGGGSPAASESASAPSAGGAGAAGGGAAISPVSNTSTILGTQQVFVTETDITDTQNNVSVIEESATF